MDKGTETTLKVIFALIFYAIVAIAVWYFISQRNTSDFTFTKFEKKCLATGGDMKVPLCPLDDANCKEIEGYCECNNYTMHYVNIRLDGGVWDGCIIGQ